MPNDDFSRGCRNCRSFARCFPALAGKRVGAEQQVERETTALDQNAFGAFESEADLARYLPKSSQSRRGKR